MFGRVSGPLTPSGGPPSYRGNQAMTPGLSHGGMGDILPVPSVGSPASAAPSPLLNPHSQPASVTPAGEFPLHVFVKCDACIIDYFKDYHSSIATC
jgi:hypothetical protein